jgi:DNA-binding NarL/FixJ family response regulator
MKTRILLAEDHNIIRQGIRSLLEKNPEFEIVGEVNNGRDAIQKAAELSPDIALMDVNMPGLNGIEATRIIADNSPEAKVIALSVHSDDAYVSGMLMAGASGYLLKDCVLDELVSAIKTVMLGHVYLSSALTKNLVNEYRSIKSKNIDSYHSLLTEREREILQLLAEGQSTKQIAADLFISIKTVSTHRQHIMEKLNMTTIQDLVKFAIREKIITT